MIRRLSALLVLALALSLPSTTTTARFGPPRAVESAERLSTEALLQKAFDEIARQRFDEALDHVENVIRQQPNFRLAHLIKGDLLMARVKPLYTVGAAPNAPAQRLGELREEAFVRLRALRERPPEDKVPEYLLELRPDQKHVVIVDTSRSRLYLYRNEGDRVRLAADYYVSIGKRGAAKMREGDQKTPVGVYHVASSVPRRKLTDFYGWGAFPINYPNEWDRLKGRNGHGIWLHGVPSDTYSRPPRSSDGCVVLSNEDLQELAAHLQIGVTPVIISEEVGWMSVQEWKSERAAFMAQLERWRADWESGDVERYLSHYSKRFSTRKQDYDAWARHKRQVNAGKTWVRVTLSNVTVLRSPGEKDLVVVTFDQDYRSNNLSGTSRKRQYWQREGGRWHIVYEGDA